MATSGTMPGGQGQGQGQDQGQGHDHGFGPSHDQGGSRGSGRGEPQVGAALVVALDPGGAAPLPPPRAAGGPAVPDLPPGPEAEPGTPRSSTVEERRWLGLLEEALSADDPEENAGDAEDAASAAPRRGPPPGRRGRPRARLPRRRAVRLLLLLALAVLLGWAAVADLSGADHVPPDAGRWPGAAALEFLICLVPPGVAALSGLLCAALFKEKFEVSDHTPVPPARNGEARYDSRPADGAHPSAPLPGRAPAEDGRATGDDPRGTVLPAGPDGPGGPVCGTVRHPDGTAVAHAALTLIDAVGRQSGRTASTDDGRYALSSPGPGAYVLIAAAAGHQPRAVSVTVQEGPVELDVLLGGSGRLSGRVHTSEGEPVGDATVTVTDSRGEVVAAARSASDGGYRLDGLVGGCYTLAATADRRPPAALPVTVDPREPVYQDVELAGGAALHGSVRAAGGRVVPDARVTLLDVTGEAVGATVTGEDGRFAFVDLVPGPYTVTAVGYPPVSTELTVGGGEQAEHDLLVGHDHPRI